MALLNSHWGGIHLGHDFKHLGWNCLIETLDCRGTPKDEKKNLVCVKIVGTLVSLVQDTITILCL